MLDETSLYPPETYATAWALLGAGLILLTVVVLVAVVVGTRPGGLPRVALGSRATRLRRTYLRRIDRIEASHRAGSLDGPTAASELSQAVRGFAAQWSGRQYPAMTLAEMETSGADRHLTEVVATLYRGAFVGAPTQPEIDAALRTAREVVRTWKPS